MAENTKIEWCDHTFNPWWGCTKVSDGCKNCYAANIDHRFHKDKKSWGPNADRTPASESMWKQPYKWIKPCPKCGLLQRTKRIFCSSMADVFDDHPSIKMEWRDRLWQTIRDTPNLDWLLLTKRPENIRKYIPKNWDEFYDRTFWAGVSIENQDTADRRIPQLFEERYYDLFLSVEPMLGPINIEIYLKEKSIDCHWERDIEKPKICWVICGGETGPGARPMNLDWARSLRDQCVDAGVPFFFKSTGGKRKSALLDGRTWKEFPS